MRSNHYQDIVVKAMAFIKANLDRPLSIPEIADNAGFSIIHVRNAFRKVLNQSILHSIQNERIQKAKMLLQKTQLNITQIAFESGFENYGGFHRVFRQNTGMTPSTFRERVWKVADLPAFDEDPGLPERKDEWFKDSFKSSEIESHWKPISGNWKQTNGFLRASGADNVISFLKPLPENSRISFQVQAETDTNLISPGFFIRLLDELRSSWFCEFTIATGKRSVGQLMHYRIGRLWDQKARIKEGTWNEVVLEFREELLSLSVNGKQIFSIREAFPSAYARRCFLDIGSYHCNVKLCDFSIQNLGFLPVIPPVRQGDILHNSGLFERARDFYIRYLAAGTASDSEVMELRYKIGVCNLRIGMLSQAQGWINKVISLQQDRFWARQAQLALLEIFWKGHDLTPLQEHLELCFFDNDTRDPSRVLIQFAVDDFVARGFFDDADQLLSKLEFLEAKGSYAHQIALGQLAENLQRRRFFMQSEDILLNLIRTADNDEIVMTSKINLMHLYNECGEIDKSEDVRIRMEQTTSDPFFLVRCRVTQAANLRAAGEPEKAIQVLQSIPAINPVEQSFVIHSKIHIAFNLCCLGELEEGRKSLEEARQISPGFIAQSQHLLPFDIAEGRYSAAAEMLLKEYRNSKQLVSLSAELGVKAGILFELEGKAEEAKSIFKEVNLRFPDEQVRYLGQLAGILMGNKTSLTLSRSKCERAEAKVDLSFDQLRISDAEIPEPFQFIIKMPYEHYRRSEMFYLIGLLMEKRGDKAAARALFELSVKDDLALRWPAFFSMKCLKSNGSR